MKITTSPNTRYSHECSQQNRKRSGDKAKSSIETSEMVMNYNYTPPTLFNTVNHNPSDNVQEREATSGIVRTCLVGEEPGFIRSPHSAPNRDWSHGLPYPFQKHGLPTANKMETTRTVSAHSYIRPSNSRPFALQTTNSHTKTSSNELPKPCILSSKIRSKFRNQIGGKQVYIHRLKSGKLVFINSSC